MADRIIARHLGEHTLGLFTEAGVCVAEYNWHPEADQPWVHPLRTTLGGGCLTTHQPFDHPWHAGLWWSWKLVNGVMFWARPDRRRGLCRVVEHAVNAQGPGVVIAQTLHLCRVDDPQSPLMREQRVLTAGPEPTGTVPGAWSLDWDLSWTAECALTLDVTPPVTQRRWGGYAGLAYRPARSMAYGQQILNGEGASGGDDGLRPIDSCHTRRARWAAYAGPLDGGPSGTGPLAGLAIFDHPQNINHPAPWYAMAAQPENDGMGLLHPSPLMTGPLELPRGGVLRLRYRVMPFAGTIRADAIEDAWRRYAGHPA